MIEKESQQHDDDDDDDDGNNEYGEEMSHIFGISDASKYLFSHIAQ